MSKDPFFQSIESATEVYRTGMKAEAQREGWVMVPREPTREMIESAMMLLKIGEVANVAEVYRAMLAALREEEK